MEVDEVSVIFALGRRFYLDSRNRAYQGFDGSLPSWQIRRVGSAAAKVVNATPGFAKEGESADSFLDVLVEILYALDEDGRAIVVRLSDSDLEYVIRRLTVDRDKEPVQKPDGEPVQEPDGEPVQEPDGDEDEDEYAVTADTKVARGARISIETYGDYIVAMTAFRTAALINLITGTRFTTPVPADDELSIPLRKLIGPNFDRYTVHLIPRKD